MAKTTATNETKRKRTTDERIAELKVKREHELCAASMAEVKKALKGGDPQTAAAYARDLLTRCESLVARANGHPQQSAVSIEIEAEAGE